MSDGNAFITEEILDALGEDSTPEPEPKEEVEVEAPAKLTPEPTPETEEQGSEETGEESKEDEEATPEGSDPVSGEPREEVTTEEEGSWQERYENLRSMNDKRFAEVNEKLKAQEGYQKAYEETLRTLLYGGEQDEPPVPVSDEDLQGGVEAAPVDTFNWALNNRPDLVPRVIAQVNEKHGMELATQMQTHFLETKATEQHQRYILEQQQREAPRLLAEAIDGSMRDVASRNSDFKDHLPRITEIVKDNTDIIKSFTDMGQLTNFIERAYLQSSKEKLEVERNTLATLPKKIDPATIVQTPRSGGPAPTTDDEQAVEELGEEFARLHGLPQ